MFTRWSAKSSSRRRENSCKGEDKALKLIHRYELFRSTSGPLSHLNNLMMPTGSKTIPSGSLTSGKVILPIPGTSNSIRPKLMLKRPIPAAIVLQIPWGTLLRWCESGLGKVCGVVSLHVLYISGRLIEMSLQLLLTALQHMTLSSTLAWGTTMTVWGRRGVIALDSAWSRYIKKKRWEKREKRSEWTD